MDIGKNIVLVGLGASGAFLSLGLSRTENDKALQFEKKSIEVFHAVSLAWHNFEVAGLWVHESCMATARLSTEYGGIKNICSHEHFRQLYYYLLNGNALEFEGISWAPNITHDERPILEKASEDCKFVSQSHVCTVISPYHSGRFRLFSPNDIDFVQTTLKTFRTWTTTDFEVSNLILILPMVYPCSPVPKLIIMCLLTIFNLFGDEPERRLILTCYHLGLVARL